MAKRKPGGGLSIGAAAVSDSLVAEWRARGLDPNIASEAEMQEMRRKIKQSGQKVPHICLRLTDKNDLRDRTPVAVVERSITVACAHCGQMCSLDPLAGPGLDYVEPCCLQCVSIIAFRAQLNRMGA